MVKYLGRAILACVLRDMLEMNNPNEESAVGLLREVSTYEASYV